MKALTFEEFLAQPLVVSMGAVDAAIAANEYVFTRVWRINDPERKVIVLTRLIAENTLPRLEAIRDSAQPTEIRNLARQLRETLDRDLLYKEEYFINLGSSEVAAGYAAAVEHGLLTATELDAFTLAATHASMPHKNATAHNVMIYREQVPQVTVTASNGFVVINVSGDCEQHNPRLMATNPRTNKTTRINNFMGVSKPGLYDCHVPALNLG